VVDSDGPRWCGVWAPEMDEMIRKNTHTRERTGKEDGRGIRTAFAKPPLAVLQNGVSKLPLSQLLWGPLELRGRLDWHIVAQSVVRKESD